MLNSKAMLAIGCLVLALVAGLLRWSMSTDTDATRSEESLLPSMKAFTSEALAPLVIVTTQLPTAAIGVPYSETLLATGGNTLTYIWTVSPPLPAGLTLNSSTGHITGTAMAPAIANCTFTLNDGASPAVLRSIPVTVDVPLPLFRAGIVVANGGFGGGMEMPVSRTIVNAGYGSGICNYSVYLSADAIITGSDFRVFLGSVTVQAKGAVTVQTPILLPLNSPSAAKFVGILLSGSGVDQSQNQSVSAQNVTIFNPLVSIEMGGTTVSTQANSIVNVPVNLVNSFKPLATHVEFMLSTGSTTVLDYANVWTPGTSNPGVSLTMQNQGGGSYYVTITSLLPLRSGMIASLRFQLRFSTGPLGSHQLFSISYLVARSAQAQQLSSGNVNGAVFVRDHYVATPVVQGSIFADAEFDVPIQYVIHSAVPIARYLAFTIFVFDSNIEVVSVRPGSLSVLNGYSVTSLGQTAANITITSPGSAFILSGEIAVVRYRVKTGGAAIGFRRFGVDFMNSSDTALPATQILLGSEKGYVVHRPDSKKDVNADGAIDVVDVQTVVNLILTTAEIVFEGQGDANNDLAVDVIDVQAVVNCILAIGNCD